MSRAFRNRELTMTYSHMAGATLPLAQRCFTSEFGKGSGGAIVLLSSAKGVRYESVVLYDLSHYLTESRVIGDIDIMLV